VVLAGHQGLEAVPGHLGWVVLAGLGDLGVLQVNDRVDVDSDQLEVVLERDVPGEVAIDADAGVEGRGIKGPAAGSLSSSAVMIRSKPLSANTRANSSPIPVDAPVTRTSGRPVLVFGFWWCPCAVFTFLSGSRGPTTARGGRRP
jgi:hypothetical protein